MKKLMIAASMLFSSVIIAQQAPTPNPPNDPTTSLAAPQKGQYAWFRGGNLNTGNPATNSNVFGTMWNSPIYTYTDGQPREKLNASLAYNVNGFNGNRDGNLLLGYSQTYSSNIFNSPNFGAFSLLHLNGDGGTFVQDGGYRPWMRTGISFTDNNDFSYFGLRKVGNGTDITETVINWSDNSGGGFPGPDDMVFRFSAGGSNNSSISSNLSAEDDLDGRHIARFTGNGEFGLGNTFGTGNPIYVRPASLQHLSLSNWRSVWTQFTNRNDLPNTGTGETAADGFRMGILGNNIPDRNGNAFIYQQEERHLLFSTNANTNNVTPFNTFERMRVTSINAPTELVNNGYGTNNPANLNGNLTRVSISHNPANPVTRPLSLLHLGYNTGAVGFNPASTDGWRNWMDIGTFTNNGTDNMYVGLKTEAGAFPASDRQDAIINWGDNDASNPLNGPDNLRFIFTSTTTGAGNSPANNNNGLEVARMVPTLASTLTAPDFGMMGIGDWTTPANIATPIDAKLDIDGDLRIREVTQDNSLYKVLVVDEPDQNRVHWRDVSSIFSDLGNLCTAAPNPLLGDYEIDLDGYSFSMRNLGQVQVGDVNCSGGSNARFYVRNNTNGSGLTTAIQGDAVDPGGIGGEFNGSQYGIHTILGGGSSGMTAAIFAEGGYATSGPTIAQWAGYFNGDVTIVGGSYYPSESKLKSNIKPIEKALEIIKNLGPITFNYNNSSFPSMNLPGDLEYGVIAENVQSVLPDLVKNITHPEVLDSAGNIVYPAVEFKGVNYTELIPVVIAGVNEISTKLGMSTLSDQTVKTNVQNLTNSLDKVKQMRGVSYEWSSSAQSTMDLDSIAHIGFIAQEVAAIEPLLTFVDDSSLVHVNYDRVAPLLVESVKELDAKNLVQDSIIQFLETINQTLEDRLTLLENCVNEANICNTQNRIGNNSDVEGKVIQLENLNAIILDQNLPNPFAEKTSINYTIPEDVMEAQLLFYDMNGRIIKQVDITERGEGKLTVYGENLQNGIYTYSLIADGKLIATKKMVKQ